LYGTQILLNLHAHGADQLDGLFYGQACALERVIQVVQGDAAQFHTAKVCSLEVHPSQAGAPQAAAFKYGILKIAATQVSIGEIQLQQILFTEVNRAQGGTDQLAFTQTQIQATGFVEDCPA
jgi:hypothetical protein